MTFSRNIVLRTFYQISCFFMLPSLVTNLFLISIYFLLLNFCIYSGGKNAYIYYISSGFISSEEFEEACHSLNKYANDVIPGSSIHDLAKTLDINKDGMIDFNEFLEAFRLVSLSVKGNGIFH